jgi:hypothetical protein
MSVDSRSIQPYRAATTSDAAAAASTTNRYQGPKADAVNFATRGNHPRRYIRWNPPGNRSGRRTSAMLAAAFVGPNPAASVSPPSASSPSASPASRSASASPTAGAFVGTATPCGAGGLQILLSRPTSEETWPGAKIDLASSQF